jgi:hypothetical protein
MVEMAADVFQIIPVHVIVTIMGIKVDLVLVEMLTIMVVEEVEVQGILVVVAVLLLMA